MAKTTAPLLSFGASGQIGKTQVYSKWKGRPYVRQHVVPANPKTANQTKTRNTFTWLNGVWKNAGSLVREAWTSFAQGQVMTDRNAFLSKNVGAMRNDILTTNMVGSPGSKGGLAANSITVTPGAGKLTVSTTNPAAPTGWTLTSMIAWAVKEQDPQTDKVYATVAGEDTVTQDTKDLTLTTGTLYRCFAVLKWTKPDGTFAYGPSLTATGTPA